MHSKLQGTGIYIVFRKKANPSKSSMIRFSPFTAQSTHSGRYSDKFARCVTTYSHDASPEDAMSDNGV